jgi:hypothetical protein
MNQRPTPPNHPNYWQLDEFKRRSICREMSYETFTQWNTELAQFDLKRAENL